MDIKKTLKRPAVMWTGLTLLLVIAALLAPMDWVRSVGTIVGDKDPSRQAFAAPVARVDRALAAGKPVAVGDQTLTRMRPHLQVRRLTKTGPMTAKDVTDATELLGEFNTQIATQKLAGSRQALRHERNRQLAAAFPRLDTDQIAAELRTLRGQIQSAR